METRDIIEEHYKRLGAAYQRKYPNEQFIVFLGMNFFSMPVGERGAIKVLELGSGSGANLWVVAREGFQAHGIDYSPAAVQFCREAMEKWGVAADVRLGDITALPYADDEFGIIFDVVSIQHLNWKQHLDAWREAHRCLKPGGAFFSYHLGENSTPLNARPEMVDHCTAANIPKGLPLENNGNLCFLSANEVRRALGEIGFSRINIERLQRSYNNQMQFVEYLCISAWKD
ncbi:MAG: class I SAM-dependent methyltransferase [Chthoniobacterales bacterium]